MRAALERALLARWYGTPGLLFLLMPLSWLYRLVVAWRARGAARCTPDTPLIVVGNITVGGSGKTPLVLWLASQLRGRGLRVGVISRGYGGRGPFPLIVHGDTPPDQCGDEPALLAQRIPGLPLVVDPDRRRALRVLSGQCVDVVISDDGLQHVALARTVEILVVDDKRRFGNGHCLPVGPLREPLLRLSTVDFVVGNGGDAGVGALTMQLQPTVFRSVALPDNELPPDAFKARFGDRVAAMAGIGDPSRFFATLRALGFVVEEHPFPDHHPFRAENFSALAGRVVVMTGKDAVKCHAIPGHSAWFLDVEAQLPPGFLEAVLQRAGLGSRQDTPA